MKIAFFHISKGIIDRGSEVSVDYLADYLSNKHQVVIFQSGQKIPNKKFQQIKIKLPFKVNSDKPKTFLGKVLERLYLHPNDLKILYFSLKLIPFLLTQKYDVIIPTNGFWQVLISKLIKIFKKTKIVIIAWAGIGYHDRDNLNLKPDLFIALTKFAYKWARSINKQVNITFVPNAVDCNFYTPNKKPIFKKKIPIILTVAALTAYKRIDLVIKAVAKMPKKCFLLIVGQGEKEKELVQLGRKLLGKNFLIKTFPPTLMPHIYNSCQVFTLASDYQDAFPRVLLEALACGRNIVVGDYPIKREIVGKVGLFINPAKIDDYSLALTKALKMHNQNAILSRAKYYSLARVGDLLEKALFAIIKI